jgi:hypothetical protein
VSLSPVPLWCEAEEGDVIGFLLPFALKLVGQKWAKAAAWAMAILAAILALVAVWGIVKLFVHRHDSHVIEQHDTAQENTVLKKELPAVQQSAEQRATDTTTIQQQKEEIRHVETAPPSGDGLTPRQRRGCVILRQQGARLADHPPCDRFKG